MIRRAIHTTLDIDTHTWLVNEAEKCKTTLSDILQKAISFYRSHRRFDPPV
jgi:hypothetical protein